MKKLLKFIYKSKLLFTNIKNNVYQNKNLNSCHTNKKRYVT